MGSFSNSKIFGLAVFIALFWFPVQTFAANLNLSPDAGLYSVGKTFPVSVYVSTPSASINAVSGSLTFPVDKLQVVSVSKVSSILTLWVSDPSFSNSAGTVDFEGVVPNPGFIGSSGKIVTINFKVIAPGSASVKWKAGSVLANDGNGTNVLQNLNPANYSLGGAAPTTEKPPAQVVPVEAGGMKITSSTYPDSNKWYTESTGKFSWNVPDGVGAVRMLVGKLSNSIPSIVYEPPIDTKQVNDTGDGVWYFSLQGRTGSTWGAVSRYMFKVDSTAPESFTIKALATDDPTNPTPQFSFIATDSTSGIDHYTIETDGNSPTNWSDNASGVYTSKVLGPGKHTILAKAYDGAGNSAPAAVDFTILGIEIPKITSYTDDVSSSRPLIVKGTALPNVTVKVILSRATSLGNLFSNASADSVPYTQTTGSDDNGSWSLSVETNKFESGVYDLSAVAIDSRGAQSFPTATKTVSINSSWWQSAGSSLIRFFAIAIPALALLFVLIIVSLHGFHRVRRTGSRLLQQVQDIERLADKAFFQLKQDVEDSVKLLEGTRNRRPLTIEEDAIIKRMRRSLSELETSRNETPQAESSNSQNTSSNPR